LYFFSFILGLGIKRGVQEQILQLPGPITQRLVNKGIPKPGSIKTKLFHYVYAPQTQLLPQRNSKQKICQIIAREPLS
jgi:hypothetical protein